MSIFLAPQPIFAEFFSCNQVLEYLQHILVDSIDGLKTIFWIWKTTSTFVNFKNIVGIGYVY